MSKRNGHTRVRCGEVRHPVTQRGAFSLIEVLVVIAIIGVLMAVLVVGLNSSRRYAQREACKAKLRQIALAWQMYLNENSGFFYQSPEANWAYGGWWGKREKDHRPLNPYLQMDPNCHNWQDAKVFCCPADRGGVPGQPASQPVFREFGTSYQTNPLLIGPVQCAPLTTRTEPLDAQINTILYPQSLNKVTRRTPMLVLMGDYGWVNQWRQTVFSGAYTQKNKERAEWHGRPDCHNMAFLDLHVDFTKIQKGYYVTDKYAILPFEGLWDQARELQGPVGQ